ncbi:hypothetical protein G3480_01545 [Thiorhodococcus mannitoliphagus]|uniref:Uncharacterized protein n=1 Tax=Thiorhodococcus mannitoliphagus TaxID=329406 RepID=A0A6P1DQ10_9GAMM|nr:hypothetical protein [Thiorhodococcus mannitoliphagus]NEX19011.1 hypothetical protein [Thiorhodococcus mannitoliphagus]
MTAAKAKMAPKINASGARMARISATTTDQMPPTAAADVGPQRSSARKARFSSGRIKGMIINSVGRDAYG